MKKQVCVASLAFLLAVGCSPNGMSPMSQGQMSSRVTNAIDRGPVSADMIFDLVVGVRMHDVDHIPLVHKQLAERTDALAPDEFGDLFAVSRWRVRALRHMAARAGARGRAHFAEPHDGHRARQRGGAQSGVRRRYAHVRGLARRVHGVDDADLGGQRSAE